MKILMRCMQCFKEDGKPSKEFLDIEIRDDGLYEINCSKAHKSIVWIQNQKFEILFEIGTMALLDGYYREAVASFVASVERFHEYCIKVFLQEKKISAENFNKTWKFINNQSERQLGAFYFLYLNTFNECPTCFFDEKNSAFRNKIIHKGYIPTKKETWDYGNKAFEYIKLMLQKIRNIQDSATPGMGEIFLHEVRQLHQSVFAGAPISTMGCPSILNLALANSEFDKKTFAVGLEGLQKYKQWLYKA